MKKRSINITVVFILQLLSVVLLFVPWTYCPPYIKSHISYNSANWMEWSFLDMAIDKASVDQSPALGLSIIIVMSVCLIVTFFLFSNREYHLRKLAITMYVLFILQLILFWACNLTQIDWSNYDSDSFTRFFCITVTAIMIAQLILGEYVITWNSVSEKHQEPVQQNVVKKGNGSASIAALERIKILKQWFDEELITQEEFDRKKQELLGLTSPSVQCRPLIMPIQNIEAMLKKCKELADNATVTPEEFADKKAQLLNMM